MTVFVVTVKQAVTSEMTRATKLIGTFGIEPQAGGLIHLNRLLGFSASKLSNLRFEFLVKKLRSIGEQHRPAKDQDWPDGQDPGEGVGKVDDGEDEGQELA